jgi:phosphoribosylaminoimidazole-succinocarboxamide synthase
VNVLQQSNLPGLPVRRGKVRDVYDLGDKLLIVATDRLSAFDVVLPTGIPEKGKVLTQLSNFWFKKFGSMFENHLLATDVSQFPAGVRGHADQLQGRSVLVKKTQVVPLECVVRGYLAGSGWKDYQKTGRILDVTLPVGLRQCEQLPEPVFTPTTKAEQGHDESITVEDASRRLGQMLVKELRERSLKLYSAAAEYARGRGIIIADTKFEWGILDGRIVLIDEILTPDSSRFWPMDTYAVGRDQASFDKQYVRNYLETLSWNKQPPGPELPADVVASTRAKYVEAFERITGERWGKEEAQKGA